MEKSIIYQNYIKPEKKNVKVYEEWKGNNKFCFKGKIYIGSEYYYGLMSFFYLLFLSFINYKLLNLKQK